MADYREIESFDPTKTAYSLWDEFKNFAFKGNVIDLAVGVIIGAAFGGIVKSLVEDIIMPLVGLLLPGTETYEKFMVGTIPVGKFLAAVINFLVIALALYIFIVKFLGWIMKSKKAEPPPPPTKEQELLTEIRDLLKHRGGQVN